MNDVLHQTFPSHVVVVRRKAKKRTKIYHACSQLLFCSLNFCLLTFFQSFQIYKITISGHFNITDDMSINRLEPEAYHLEAINSDPMLGFFREPIKIYFLIWSAAHFMYTSCHDIDIVFSAEAMAAFVSIS